MLLCAKKENHRSSISFFGPSTGGYICGAHITNTLYLCCYISLPLPYHKYIISPTTHTNTASLISHTHPLSPTGPQIQLQLQLTISTTQPEPLTLHLI